jgi:opacity protein-like surface antigen
MRSIMCLAAAAALALLVGPVAPAQNVGLEAHGLYAFNFNDDDSDGSNADNTFGGGASLVFNLHPNIKLDLGADYYKPENKDDSDVKAQFIPVCATLRVGGKVETIFLYAGGGAGYSFNDLDIKGLSSSDIEMEDCVIYFGCAGAELGLSDQVVIRGEFRYNWLKPEIKDKRFDVKEDVKFDHMQIRAGLGFYF